MKQIGASQLCRLIGISRRRLSYLQEAGYIEPPKKNFAGHRVFDENDIDTIKKINQQLNIKRNGSKTL